MAYLSAGAHRAETVWGRRQFDRRAACRTATGAVGPAGAGVVPGAGRYPADAGEVPRAGWSAAAPVRPDR